MLCSTLNVWQSAVITALDAWSVIGSNTKQRVSKVNTTWGTSRMNWHLGRYGCADILLQQAPCCSEGARWVGACRDAKLIQGIVLVPVCARVNRWHPCQRGVLGRASQHLLLCTAVCVMVVGGGWWLLFGSLSMPDDFALLWVWQLGSLCHPWCCDWLMTVSLLVCNCDHCAVCVVLWLRGVQ